jgi:Fe-S cluster biogenesis protein NfuA
VLDSVRPYLIADGGNCRVVSVDAASGDVAVEMEGACGMYRSIDALLTLYYGAIKPLSRLKLRLH